MTECGSKHIPYGSTTALVCTRTDLDEQGRHKGRHQCWEDVPEVPAGSVWPAAGQPAEDLPAFRRLWDWDEGGSRGHNRETSATAQPCPKCNTLTPEKDIKEGLQGPACFFCRFWDEKAYGYNDPTTKHIYIRPHDDKGVFSGESGLYAWSPGSSGGFGNRSYRIKMDDGREFGPASSLWFNGRIPWWRLDEFPPNGRIEEANW